MSRPHSCWVFSPCCEMSWLLLDLELAGFVHPPRWGCEIINKLSRSTWGRSAVMAAPPCRPNYFCLVSVHQIITHLLDRLWPSSRCRQPEPERERASHLRASIRTDQQANVTRSDAVVLPQNRYYPHTHTHKNLCLVHHEGYNCVNWRPLGQQWERGHTRWHELNKSCPVSPGCRREASTLPPSLLMSLLHNHSVK